MRFLALLVSVALLGRSIAPAQQPPSMSLYQDAGISLSLIEAADKLCERKEYVAALKKLEDAFLFLPNNVRLNLDAAGRAAAKGDAMEVYQCLQRANQGFENLPVIFSLTGRVRRKAGDFYGAIEAYNSALLISPQHTPALAGRAAAKEEIDDYDGALADYGLHIATGYRPGMEQVYFRRGMLHMKLGDKARAEEDFRSSIRVKPTYSSPYAYLGSVLHESGKMEEALAACDQAIALSPEDARPYNMRLWTYYDMGRFDQAMADATKCMDLMPENGNLVLYRAVLQELLGKTEAAAQDYARAIELAERSEDHGLWFYACSYRDLLQRSRSERPDASYLDDVLSWRDSWHKRLGLYLAGITTAETLLKDSRHAKRRFDRQQQQCEANFFIGMINVSRGDLAKARIHLQQCRQDMPAGMIETALAEFQLRRLARP
jgi:tetratricopeptide (TPR) repeat protein